MIKTSRTVEQLADEIFALVQFDQGKGFISDGLGALETQAKLFAVVRGHLEYTERAAKKIRRWLNSYAEL